MTERKPKTQSSPSTEKQLMEKETKIQELENQLVESTAKTAEFFDGWQRERADFLNYKKRIEQNQIQTQQNLLASMTRKYLQVMDDLERALKAQPSTGEGAAWAEGIELIYKKLQGILEADGVKEIVSDGQMFDPNFHEAITHEDSPAHESGQIIEVIQKGYLIGDRIIRPSLVRVAR